MARTVEDVELAVRVLTNSAPTAWLPRGATVRMGVCRPYGWEDAEKASREAVEETARPLSRAGIAVREVALPALFGELRITREIINDFERARGMAHEWHTEGGQISEGLAKSIRRGLSIERERYTDALQRVAACRNELAAVFADTDILLAPTAHGEAPLGLNNTGDHRFQSIWTQLRTPTVSLPTHSGPNAMPIGIQLIAKPYADADLLAVAQLVFTILGRGPVVSV
jgi:Asp-tRNA(Asn)/Glu-tRNA(Gln) amidotransferase A subunit family amidase